MGDVELHADYDRDGRLTGRESEYAARATPPGAILGVNLDRDGRALPETPRAGAPVALDHTRPTRPAQDDELLPILVRIEADLPFAALRLRIVADDAAAIGLLDEDRHVLRAEGRRDRQAEFALPLSRGEHRFFLEASRIPGSPNGAPNGAFTVSVIGDDTVLDTGHFTVAPFFVLDDGAPAEAVFICTAPDNGAAIRHVADAVGRKLRVIGVEECSADTWMQDQFQLGYVATAKDATRVLLHLPRIRRNAQLAPGSKNLAQLVRAHFPSTDLGLVDDLWNRTVDIHHRDGSTPVSIEASEEVFRIFKSVSSTEEFLRSMTDRMCAALGRNPPPRPDEPLPLSRSLQALRPLELEMRAYAEMVSATGKFDAVEIDAMLDRARVKVAEAGKHLRRAGTRIVLTLSGSTFHMDDAEIDALMHELARIHDAVVYGGNIEASPPTADAPFGKVVIGSTEDRPMDSPLRELLAANQRLQPVVEIDTSWLAVAHVDELIAFVDSSKSSGPPVIFRASPEVAYRLLFAATDVYERDSDGEVQTWAAFQPHIVTRHGMNRGKHPITRMFRGKSWMHVHPPRETEDDAATGAEGSEPPQIYLNLVHWHAAADIVSPVRYVPGSSLPRDYYAAKMTIWEAMYFEDVNETIEKTKLQPLDDQLQREFPDFPIRRVPVLFDDAPLVSDAVPAGATTAFTPNLANLQRVGDVVLIPRPFGPRMSPADAAIVISAVLRQQKLDGIASRITPAFFAREGLDVLSIWMNRDPDGMEYRQAVRTLAQVAEELEDSFPQGTPLEERKQRIRRANPRSFEGENLARGWQKILVPGKSVDLFEAYTHALLRDQGCTPAWIDTWYYHVRHGEIHCGTNVLRAVPKDRRKWWG